MGEVWSQLERISEDFKCSVSLTRRYYASLHLHYRVTVMGGGVVYDTEQRSHSIDGATPAACVQELEQWLEGRRGL